MPVILEPFHVRHRTLILMSILGAIYHPSLDRIIHSKWIRRMIRIFVVCAGIPLIYIPGTSLYHFLFQADTMTDTVLDLLVFDSGLHAAGRIFWFYLRRPNFKHIYEVWNDLFGNDRDVKEREKSIYVYYSKVRDDIRLLTIILTIMVTVWYILQILSPERKMKAKAPFNVPEEAPQFEIICIYYLCTCITHSICTACLQLYTLLPLCWECGELSRLRNTLPKVIRPLRGDGSEVSAASLTKIHRELGIWIEQHQKVTRFHELCDPLLKIPYSLEMLATFMAAWLVAFAAVQESITFVDKISYVVYYLPYLIMFKITCTYCEHLLHTSLNVFQEAFVEEWSALPLRYRKSLQIIQVRCQKPLIVKGFNIIPVGDVANMQIMQSAYSMLNFMIAALRRDA